MLDLRLGYSEACGSAELRGLIAAAYENTSPDEILITTGAIEANFLFNELLSAGDRIVVVSPAYQQLHSLAKAIGCEVASGNYATTKGFADLAICARLQRQDAHDRRQHPAQSDRAMLSEQQLREIYALAEELDAWVLNDEAYRWLDLPGSPPRPADAKPWSPGYQYRHIFEAVWPPRFAHRLDRGAS